ncbi:hypothetical protein FB45DRAFT_1103229 [Roridomyces roridus]|uniref:F-box domain-containing protein n=1 Tax=Roridomyces roridus TaxID=1738132 RepID=A0AAD7BDY9_9AGAR|nr:hypothetical protein FB45DRAFT_1103229 [Roridomyces roridus]
MSHSDFANLEISPRAAPISSLFPEILCQIFTLVIPPLKPDPPLLPPSSLLESDDDAEGHLIPPGPPWVLGQVCGQWRAIALAYGPLWSSILLSTCCDIQQRRFIERQLDRAGTSPLNVLLRFTSFSDFDHLKHVLPTFNKIVERRAQWRSLHLEFHCAHWPPAAFAHLGSLPMLQELRFSGRGTPEMEKDWERVFQDVDMPNLRHAILGEAKSEPSPIVMLPWDQLTVYKATYTDPLTHFANLSTATNLVECDLDFGELGFQPVGDLGVVTLPHLRRLVITSASFLPHFLAPALEDINVHGDQIEHVLPFLNRSQSAETLKKLTLFMCDAAASEVIVVLHHTTTLIWLAIDFLGPQTETALLVEALCIQANESIVCPRLTSLSWGDRCNTDERVRSV